MEIKQSIFTIVIKFTLFNISYSVNLRKNYTQQYQQARNDPSIDKKSSISCWVLK